MSGLVVMVWVRGWLIHDVYESPHKETYEDVCVCGCVKGAECLATTMEIIITLFPKKVEYFENKG